MGLFDRIKKFLPGHKDEDQEEKEEHKVDEEATKETWGSEINIETEVSENESDLASKETNKTDKEEAESFDETPGWSDAGSVFEESQNEVAEKTVEAEDTSSEEEQKFEEHEGKVSESETGIELVANTEEESDEKAAEEEDEQERYDKGLEKTNHFFGAHLNAFFVRFRTVDEDFFDDLEDLLIESDVGFETAEELTDSLRDEAKLWSTKGHDDLKQVIVEKLADIYDKGGEGEDSKLADDSDVKPDVYLFVRVSDAGKTTIIDKLTKRIKDSGKSVMMVAADTFRTGVVEQLVEWGRHGGVEVVTGPEKADPASVVRNDVRKAKDRGIDFLLVDTAGRLQDKVNLMSEPDKIKRTIKKILSDQPNEVPLVPDGPTGQNALLQAKDFDKTAKFTGPILTKLDGSSKGGVVLAIKNEMDLPVKPVGLEEKADDLANFDIEKFAIGLF